MSWPIELVSSYLFLAFIISWASAVLLKATTASLKNRKKWNIMYGLTNGGMPSTHSAAIASITAAIALNQGLTPVFYLAVVVSLIIISDAMGIRKNLGVQGEALNKVLIKLQKDPINVVYGHSFFQVIVGTGWGILVAILVSLAF